MKNSKGLPTKRRNKVIKESIYEAEPEYLENKVYWEFLALLFLIVMMIIAIVAVIIGSIL